MNIRCPNCGTMIDIDDASYSKIVEQVRNEEFNKSLQRELAVREDSWKSREEALKAQNNVAIQNATNDVQNKLNQANNEIQRLNSQIEIQRQQSELDRKEMADTMKKSSDEKIKELEEQLDYYKDMKTKMSTKMVGESLEQHCYNEFNKVRQVAFPNAYFEKDNEISKSGSKGDFIYREAIDGVEFISIMFDMKNEMPSTEKRHKNEDFFKELDKDRREKNCEYAVLVSLLEPDNDFYNSGIVDVSYKFPKMYVIRPQYFISFIGLLRGAALNAVDAKRELAEYKGFNLDVVRFEKNIEDFKHSVDINFSRASNQFQEAINEIDKTIDHLEKVKASLTSSKNNTEKLMKKTDDMSALSLSTGSPSIRKMFKEYESNNNSEVIDVEVIVEE